MKKNNINYFIFFCLILFWQSCKKCESDCGKGFCSKGECECFEGWEGLKCNEQTMPLYVVIDSIKVTKFPYYRQDNTTWDSIPGEEAPDLKFYYYFGSFSPNYVDFISSEVFFNADKNKTYTFTKDFPIKIGKNNLTKYMNLHLADFDKESNIIKTMGGYYFYLYRSKNNFPRVIVCDLEDYHTGFVIYIHYEF
jgi:hypothetical protein